ncbi:MAG: hypothetical protein K2L21_00425 [Muribaculaceae bacterium]|nr:hypothetical protein [Muribaculaceae bacterium]
MTQQEFEQLTGMKVTAEQYKEVERAYMVSNLSKQEFCAEWPKLYDSEVVQDLVEIVEAVDADILQLAEERAEAIRAKERAQAALNDAMVELDGARKELEDAKTALRSYSDRCDALLGAMLELGADAEELAATAAGRRAVTAYKCSHDLKLNPADRALIAQVLTTNE